MGNLFKCVLSHYFCMSGTLLHQRQINRSNTPQNVLFRVKKVGIIKMWVNTCACVREGINGVFLVCVSLPLPFLFFFHFSFTLVIAHD